MTGFWIIGWLNWQFFALIGGTTVQQSRSIDQSIGKTKKPPQTQWLSYLVKFNSITTKR